jgi:hypothetical protein
MRHTKISMSCIHRGVALAAICVVSMAHGCGTVYTVIRHYQIPDLHDTTFALPHRVEARGYELLLRRRDPVLCQRLALYRLKKKGSVSYEFYVGLTQTRPRALEVVYGYLRAGDIIASTGGPPDAGTERRMGARADIVAQLAMQDAGVTLTVPPDTIVRLGGGHEQLEEWCSRGYAADSTYRVR